MDEDSMGTTAASIIAAFDIAVGRFCVAVSATGPIDIMQGRMVPGSLCLIPPLDKDPGSIMVLRTAIDIP